MGNSSIVTNRSSDNTVFIEEFSKFANPLHHEPARKLTLSPHHEETFGAGVHIRFIHSNMHYLFRDMDALKITISEQGVVTVGNAKLETFQHRVSPLPGNSSVVGPATAVAAITGAGVIGAAAPAIAVAGVQGIGFGTGGIVAGSTAAGMMAAEGSVAAGGTVATLQSIGATGALSAGAAIGVVAIGIVVGAAIIGGGVYGALKLHEHLKYKDNACWDTCRNN